ncbi:MAG TPA: C-GCAxxG-C-C family protein [Candidatus Sumerlaeota bacterium]|nr:C-GCAxxG-C-C family protein [Candidatus Sumerlaeota bacterium]
MGSDRGTEAVEMLQSGFNCAQSVLVCCGEKLPFDRDVALGVASAFGGGLGSSGNLCGAVAGGVMAIGLKHPRTDPQDQEAKETAIRLTREFLAKFRERNGSIECKELLGVDLSLPGSLATARDTGLFQTVCSKAVRDAVEILEEVLK